MAVIHFIEIDKKQVVLTQILKKIPAVDADVKIKGRKGKIMSVEEKEENIFHVQVFFEPIVKKQISLKDDKKRRR
ncbi:hypothetical protein IEO70_08175 [Bacillus sp. AGMB 02131]|uniref:Uncharacterized protein n=1 Tax=Peribacillus faecalis TaxID=2772559 RepID=A0A927CWG5_9BACI|nr:hypothetical protein [Peribacillus faecalis]MBD3108341.1 hypothetical protein [Peribacillus faecalis]